MALFKRGYGFYSQFISLLLLICLLIPSYSFAGHGADDRVSELIKRAEDKKLHSDRYWHILLHYKTALFDVISLIDDPNFFLSSEGKTNPQAELEATIETFFHSKAKGDDHPICRFTGRYSWLKEELDLNDDDFADIDCRDFKNKRDVSVQPRSLVLVFPAFFMNNPASMFGHTMLRIDSAYESKLLGHAANYAAHIDDSGMLYPFKGVFGFYKGFYKVFPYYETIKEYGDIEQRDMWEYRLDLSAQEVQRMFLHLWELKDVYSHYYFFDENCSYNILFLLEAARPTLHLTDQMGLWVIPVDTIRKIKESGIVTDVQLRLSVASRIRTVAKILDKRAIQKAMEIAKGESAPKDLSRSESKTKGRTLDLASELIQYRYYKKLQSPEEYRQYFLAVLRERSTVGNFENEVVKSPKPFPPEEGHLSGRLALGLGIREDVLFQEIKYRPAYHSLVDPDRGYQNGSQIIFGDTALRYYSGGTIKLDKLDLIDIVSIAPRDYFFKPISWKVKTGLVRQTNHYGEEKLVYQLHPGAGLAYKNDVVGIYYLFAGINLFAGSAFRDRYAAGLGLQAGLLKNLNDFWKIHLSTEMFSYEIGDRYQDHKITVAQSFRLSKNNGVEVTLSGKRVFHNTISEANINWNYYF